MKTSEFDEEGTLVSQTETTERDGIAFFTRAEIVEGALAQVENRPATEDEAAAHEAFKAQEAQVAAKQRVAATDLGALTTIASIRAHLEDLHLALGDSIR